MPRTHLEVALRESLCLPRFCRSIWFAFLICASCLSVNSLNAAAVQGLVGQALEPKEVVQRHIRRQQSIAEMEIELLVSELELPKVVTAAISHKTLSEIESVFPTPDAIEEGASIDIELRAKRELEQLVHRVARETMDRDKLPSLDAYIANSIKRNVKLDFAAQETVLHLLDGVLSLSQEQERELLELLADNWSPELNTEAGTALIGGISDLGKVMSLLERIGVVKVFSEAQRLVFEAEDRQQMTMADWMVGNELDIDRVRNRCTAAMELRIAELTEICDLNEKQVRYLSVARKGAVEQVLRAWQATFDQSSGINDLLDSLDGIKLVSDPLKSQCESQPKWKKVLEKILDEDQRKKLEHDVLAQEQRRRRVLLNYATSTFLSKINLTQDQLGKLEKTISGKIFVDGRIGYVDPVVDFMLLEDELIEPCLSDLQWQKVAAEFAMQREAIREMRRNQKARNEDADRTNDP